MKKIDLGKDNINHLLLSFAIPCVISMLINSVYNIIGSAVTISIVVSILLSILSYLFLPQLVYFFGCTKNVYPYAVDYDRIFLSE